MSKVGGGGPCLKKDGDEEKGATTGVKKET